MDKFFRSEVLKSDLYHVEHYEGIKLNQNESPWDLPVDLKVKITERLIKIGWNHYPIDALTHLQKKLAQQNGLQPDQIVVSNGSNTLIQALINIIYPQNKVLVLDPTFNAYEVQANLHGNKVIKVPLSEDFELLTERTITTIKKEKPALVFISNPNTPTGTLFEKRSLYRIIQSSNCPVIIDEAYYPFSEETVIDWLNDFDNLVVMRSFSKAMALAAVRCGYLISSVGIASQVEKFLMPYRLSTISAVIIDEVLDNPEYINEYVKATLKERSRVLAKMQKLNNLQVFPSEANFLLFRVSDSQHVSKKLMSDKILVRNMDDGGGVLKNCFRVTIGTPEENDRFLTAIKSAVPA